jgi:anti-sigma regulatory factor (Ser/Thr protein kinase)
LQRVSPTEVTLTLKADLDFLPLATAFAEKAARALGLDDAEALALTLATEEIFAYLCKVAAAGRQVQIRCQGRGYYVQEDFLFEALDFTMRAFNLTCSVIDDPTCLDETGLLIASRMVDRLRVSQEDESLRLTLIKERSYPAFTELRVPPARPLDRCLVRWPDQDELKLFVRMLKEHYESYSVPKSFGFPGKVVDMVASGEYAAALAVDAVGHIGGGLLWWQEGSRMVEFFGPYIFAQPSGSDVPQALIDFLISSVARTGAIALINRYPTPELPENYFEPLGTIVFRQPDGSAVEMKPCYRHLDEDRGLTVWTHVSIEPFLEQEYRRLFFARELRQAKAEGEYSSRYAVLSADLDRRQGRAILHPVWWGDDSYQILAAHVDTLLRDGLPNILFEMDLGKSWHCYFAPALQRAGFEPRLVLPYAGTGDLVIFQYTAREKSL